MRRLTFSIILLFVLCVPCVGLAQSSGTFAATASMTTSRYDYNATLLRDGRVLVSGGYGRNGEKLTSAEIYDPATGVFTPTGSMMRPRYLHNGTLMQDGRVWISGGVINWPVTSLTFPAYLDAYATSEFYDPATGMFTLAATMPWPQVNHNATLLPDGKVLMSAGADGDSGWAEAAIYEPDLEKFVVVPANTNGYCDFWGAGDATILSAPAVLLTNGKVFLPGSRIEVFDPVSRTFLRTTISTTPGITTFYISGRTATMLTNGKVLVVGGETAGIQHQFLSNGSLYDSDLGTFTATGNLSVGQHNHTATLLPNGKVLIAGGTAGDPLPTDSRYGYFECGIGSAVNVRAASPEFYDPQTGVFSTILDSTPPRTYETSILLHDGRVLLIGNSGAEIYTPASETVPRAVNARFDNSFARLGGSFAVTFTGTNLNSATYFDVKFRVPGGSTDIETWNWQQGLTATHALPDYVYPGTYVITGLRAHQDRDTHEGDFFPSSIPVTISSAVVTDLKLDRDIGVVGSQMTASLSGINLSDTMYFDVRFRSPGSNIDAVAWNWQRGQAVTHEIPPGTTAGDWTITGVWPHQKPTDHSTDFFPVSASFRILP
jgi:hypothetical protein